MRNDKVRVVSRLAYHFAWTTLHQEHVLTDGVKIFATNFLEQKCQDAGCSISELYIGSYYVYIYLKSPPKYSPAQIVQLLKGSSAVDLRSNYPHLTQSPFVESLWDRGYFTATSGDFVGGALREYLGLSPAKPETTTRGMR